MHMVNLTPHSPEDEKQHRAWYAYMAEWQMWGFYENNPVSEPTRIMDYRTYREGRENGTITGPTAEQWAKVTAHPIHDTMTHDGV